MKSRFKQLLILLLSLVTACTEPRSDRSEDRLDRLQMKIDQGLYEESISELQEILKKEPSNEKARVILASVYVRRSGISVNEYFVLHDIFSGKDQPEADVLDLENIRKLISQDESLKAWNKVLSEVNEAAKMTKKISRKFDRIPQIDSQSAKDIYLALVELEKLKNPKAGSALYRGVIKLLYFKFLWSENKLIPVGNYQFCSLRVSDVIFRIDSTKQFIVGMIEDIAHGFPEDAPAMIRTANQVKGNMSQATLALKNLGLQNQVVSKVLKIEGLKCDF